MGCTPPLLRQSLACHPSHIHRFAHHRVRQSLQRRTARPRLSPGRSPATAGLYNELLLKSGQDATGQKVSTNLQNAFMYTASILWLLLYLGVQGKLRDAVSAENLQVTRRHCDCDCHQHHRLHHHHHSSTVHVLRLPPDCRAWRGPSSCASS